MEIKIFESELATLPFWPLRQLASNILNRKDRELMERFRTYSDRILIKFQLIAEEKNYLGAMHAL